MKKILTLLLIISLNAQAQNAATIGIQYTTKGFGMDAGYLLNNIQLKAGYNVSIPNTTIPNYTYVSAGYRIALTKNEDWFNTTITPSIGISKYSKTVMQKTDAVKVTGFKPIFGFEIGRACTNGVIYLSAEYCTMAYVGLGMRVFIK